LASIIQLTSFILLAGGLVAVRLVAFPFAAPATHVEAAHRRSSAARAALGTGVAGTVVGIVHALQYLDHPDQIGPGLAVALICLLYGALAWLVLKAGEHRRAVAAIAAGETVPVAFDRFDAGAVAAGALMTLLFTVFVVLSALHV
jgi:flagellar motor component MotA